MQGFTLAKYFHICKPIQFRQYYRVQCLYPDNVFFLLKQTETKKLPKPKIITQFRKVRLKPRLFNYFINIPEKCQKRIRQHTMWETQAVLNLSNLIIFETNNGALEYAAFLVSCSNFLMYFLKETLLNLIR